MEAEMTAKRGLEIVPLWKDIRSFSEMYNEGLICAETLKHFPVWLDN